MIGVLDASCGVSGTLAVNHGLEHISKGDGLE